MPSGIGEILCVYNLFGQTSFACEGSATSICRCQVSSPLPVRPESSMRLKPLSRGALVWSHLIYAGINLLWAFFCLSSMEDFHMRVPQTTVLLFIPCYSLGWDTGVVCWDSKRGRSSFSLYSKLNSAKTVATAITHTKSYRNRLISPFSHLLFRAVEGFSPSSQGQLLPGQTAVLWAPCLCVPLAWFSQNCCPPNIIPYLLGHWNWNFLPASDSIR